ncbi:MAG: type II secretion system F family protein [Deferribacteraceae bacterium]|jgi:type II secretory pathway component PulF|nr:type II secretion system F family protein [Deferribacteraceae bacterium]
MATFVYVGTTKTGKSAKGTKEALSKQAALVELTAAGIFVSDIRESGSKTRLKAFQGLIKPKKNLADYFFQVSLLLRSGIPLVEAQNIVARTMNSPKEREIILDTASKISEGMRFSDAMARHETYFDPMYVNLVKASEKVGRLAEVLMDIAEYEEQKGKNTDKLTSAIIYPSFIMTAGMGVIVFLLVVIVPKMQGIFNSVKQELPSVTKAMLAMANFTKNYGLLVFFLVVVGAITLQYMYRKNEKFRMRMDRRLFKIDMVAQSAMTRFAHILSFQLKEGLPLTDALYYATLTVNNRYMKSVLEDVRGSVQAGVKFSTAVKEVGIFPELFPAAVSTGEKSGNMPELLERVNIFYAKKIDKAVSGFLSILEPLFIVLIGGMVGFVVVAIMLPLFDINTMVQ